MKLAVALASVACGAARPSPAPAPHATCAVLGLEPDGVDPALAARLTGELRAEARAAFVLAPDRDLADMKRLASCPTESAACLAAIGGELEVDYVIFGHVEATRLWVRLLDVKTHVARRAASVPLGEHAAHDAFAQLAR